MKMAVYKAKNGKEYGEHAVEKVVEAVKKSKSEEPGRVSTSLISQAKLDKHGKTKYSLNYAITRLDSWGIRTSKDIENLLWIIRKNDLIEG